MSNGRTKKIEELKKQLEEEQNKNEEERDESKIRDLTQKIMMASIGLNNQHVYGRNKTGLGLGGFL